MPALRISESTRNWLLMLFVSPLIILQQCDKNAISVVAVIVSNDLGLNSAQMGLVISCFFLSYSAMNVVGGYLSDAFGSRLVILAVVVLWSLFTGITGLAWSFASLLAIRLLFGAAEGGFPPAASRLVAELFSAEKRALPKSFLSAVSALGVGVASIAVAAIANGFGWRTAFALFAVVGFALASVFASVSGFLKRPCGTPAAKAVPMRNLLRIPLLWQLLPMQFAAGVFILGLNSWMPSYWMNVKGLKLVSMGYAAAIPHIASFAVMICFGWIMDKFLMGKEKVLMASCALIGGVFVYLTFIVPNVAAGILCMTVSSISVSVLTQCNMVCAIKYFPADTVGSGSGIANFGNQSAGIVAPSVMGFILHASKGSYAAVFGFAICALAIAFLIALTVDTKEAARRALAGREPPRS